MIHRIIQTQETHHGSNLGGSHHLPMAMGPTSKCHFVSGLPSGSFEIFKVGTLVTLKGHNFVCKSPIEMRFEEKL